MEGYQVEVGQVKEGQMEGQSISKREDLEKLLAILMEGPLDESLNVASLTMITFHLCSDLTKGRKIIEEYKQGVIGKDGALSRILKDWLDQENGNEKWNLTKLSELFLEHGLKTLSDKTLAFQNELTQENGRPVTRGLKRKRLTQLWHSSNDSSSTSNQKSIVEVALSNSVILEEIFKKLSFADKKSFRLVNSMWLTETLSYWRRTVWISMTLSPRIPQVHIKQFLALLEKEQNIQQELANPKPKKRGRPPKKLTNKTELTFNLLNHPFRRFKIFGMSISYHQIGKEIEDTFWRLCGPYITHLQLSDYFYWARSNFTPVDMVKEMLVCHCPKLEELVIQGEDDKYGPSLITKKKKAGPNPDATATKFAAKLETLAILGGGLSWETNNTEAILKCCPRLKKLNLDTGYSLKGLDQPTNCNEELIKLQWLKLCCKGRDNYDFSQLDNYLGKHKLSQSIQTTRENSIKHLKLTALSLNEIRSHPFTFYSALQKCSKGLKSVYLEIECRPRDSTDWFMELCMFHFPNLTELKLVFKTQHRQDIRFDFDTLKNMPELEVLELQLGFKKINSNIERPKKDWIYKGPRDTYIPEASGIGSSEVAIYSPEEKLCCQKLKKFSFDGWVLEKHQVELLAGWFPNLIYLSAPVECYAVVELLECWKNLESLYLRQGSTTSFEHLHYLKQKRENLKVVQDFNHFGEMTVIEIGGKILYEKL